MSVTLNGIFRVTGVVSQDGGRDQKTDRLAYEDFSLAAHPTIFRVTANCKTTLNLVAVPFPPFRTPSSVSSFGMIITSFHTIFGKIPLLKNLILELQKHFEF